MVDPEAFQIFFYTFSYLNELSKCNECSHLNNLDDFYTITFELDCPLFIFWLIMNI